MPFSTRREVKGFPGCYEAAGIEASQSRLDWVVAGLVSSQALFEACQGGLGCTATASLHYGTRTKLGCKAYLEDWRKESQNDKDD